MAQFGGWSQYGSSQFGGQLSWSERYYRILKSIYLPGFWSLDDGTIGNRLLRGDAKLLEFGQLRTDALQREVFPHEAVENQAEWESLLNVVPAAGATVQTRRDAIVSKWRGAKPSTLAAIAEALADVLNPEFAWRDDFENGTRFWYYELRNGGYVSETAGNLVPNNPAAANWPDDAVLCLMRCNAPLGDLRVQAEISDTSAITNGDTRHGLLLYGDDDNAIFLTAYTAASVVYWRVDIIEDGVFNTDVLGGAETEPVSGGPYWAEIGREGNEWVFKLGATHATLAEIGRSVGAQGYRVRKVGLFSYNTATGTGAIYIGEWRVQFDVKAHNVTIKEIDRSTATNAEIDVTGADKVFVATITRYPEDAGLYDIAAAQRIADRMAQAHTLITVGETMTFLCDDPESLCDRDPLGV